MMMGTRFKGVFGWKNKWWIKPFIPPYYSKFWQILLVWLNPP